MTQIFSVDPEMNVAIELPAIAWLMMALELAKRGDQLRNECEEGPALHDVCISCETAAMTCIASADAIMQQLSEQSTRETFADMPPHTDN